MLRFAEIAVGNGSLRACRLCGTPEAVSYTPAAELDAVIAGAVDAWGTMPGPNVSLGGPESFDHPELPTVVAAAVGAGVERIRLETSGEPLALPGNARGALDAGVRHLRFVLHAADPQLNASMTGSVSAFDERLAGAKKLASAIAECGARVHISALVPVCRHNTADLPGIVGLAASLGARSVTLLVDPQVKVSPAVVAAACDSGTVNGVWVSVEGTESLPEGFEVHRAREFPLGSHEAHGGENRDE